MTSIRKNRSIRIIVLGAAAAIAIVTILATTTNSRREVPEPIPTIVMVYKSDIAGAIQGYAWQGHFPAPNTEFKPPENLVNITKGTTVEFVSANASRQPDYYLVTVTDITDPRSEQSVFEGTRLEGNKLVIDYKQDRTYLLKVAGTWVRIDLFGQHSDYVVYAYKISVT